eukprot:118420_1
MADQNEEKKEESKYPNYIGKTNNIQQELLNLQNVYGKNFAKLYDRKYEYVGQFDYKDKTIATINIMQFNILADGLTGTHVSEQAKDAKSQSKTFVNVPKDCLIFHYRGFRILEEITRNQPDIICLQECDQFDFLLYYLSPLGYKGEFNPKSKSPCVKIAKENGLKLNADGVAIFYMSNKFKKKVVQKFGKTIENTDVDVPAINILFTHQQTNKDFIVTCVHLKSKKNLEGENIRLGQLQHILPITQKLSTSALSSSKTNDIPVFVAADLNTNNNETYSTAYNSIMFPDELKKNKENDTKGLKPDMAKDYIDGYGLNLWSAYYSNSIPNSETTKDSEPIYTTYKRRSNGIMKHCIDYIFYQKHKVKLVRLLSIPHLKEINEKTLLPGFEYPSDHVAIQACFQF